MGFGQHAWKAAAEQYGANRAEKYGAIFKIVVFLQVVMCIVFAVGIIYLINIGPRG
jgi:hypothetical protein